MNKMWLAVLWIGSLVIAMFLTACGTVAYVTRDMMSGQTQPALQDDGDADVDGEDGGVVENMKRIWAARIPPGERRITWLV